MLEQAAIEYNMLILFHIILELKVIIFRCWVQELTSFQQDGSTHLMCFCFYHKYNVAMAIYPELKVSVVGVWLSTKPLSIVLAFSLKVLDLVIIASLPCPHLGLYSVSAAKWVLSLIGGSFNFFLHHHHPVFDPNLSLVSSPALKL